MTPLDGPLLNQGDAGYEDALADAVWNARKPDRKPAAIVKAQSENDVVEAVALAREVGQIISVRAGGHAWTAYPVRDGGLLIDMSALTGIAYDDSTHTVSIQPGVRSQDLATFLA